MNTSNNNKPDYLALAKRIAKHQAPPVHLVDFTLQNEGSIVFLHPLTKRAIAWVTENIGQDNGFQPQWPSVLCEPRYLEPILQGIADAGMVVL